MVNYVRDYNYVDRDIFNPPLNLLNIENGVYDLNKDDLLDHNPDYYFLNKIPIKYNPDARINQIEQFLQDILPTDSITTVQESFGYTLYRSYYIQKAFMYIGGGSNGKSTLLALLRALLGIKK